jgi:hypothetical protein
MKKYFAIGIPTVALTAIALGASAGIGQLAPISTRDAAKPQKYCVDIPNQSLKCFNTEAEAMRVASGGRINLTHGRTARSLSSAQLQQSVYYIEAILYRGRDYGGDQYWILSPNQYPACPIRGNISSSFNDKTSSLWVQDSCGITLYENANWGGRRKRFNRGSTPSVGSDFNDKASSYSFP